MPLFLARRLTYQRKIYSQGVTYGVAPDYNAWAWLNCSAQSSFLGDGLEFKKSLPLSYFASPAISRCPLSVVDKTMEGILFHLFSLFFQDVFGRRNNENNNIHPVRFIFWLCAELSIRLSSKPVAKTCKNVFRPKKMNSSLFLFIFERRNVAFHF